MPSHARRWVLGACGLTVCLSPPSGERSFVCFVGNKDVCDSQLQSNEPLPPRHSCDTLSNEILYLLHLLSWLQAVTLARLRIALLSLTILFQACIS